MNLARALLLASTASAFSDYFLQFLQPNIQTPLNGTGPDQFSYASSSLTGLDLDEGQTLVSDTNNMSFLVSNKIFKPTNETLLVFEAYLRSDSYLGKSSDTRSLVDSDFFYGAPLFGTFSEKGDWQFLFYITNKMIFAVVGQFDPKAITSGRVSDACYLYAVPIFAREPCDANTLAITFKIGERNLVNWYVEGDLRMSINDPGRTNAISGKFMFAQRPGKKKTLPSFPTQLRLAIGNIDIFGFYGREGTGSPWPACQCALFSCINPSPFKSLGVSCRHAKLPQEGDYKTEMYTTVFYTAVARLVQGQVVDRKCGKHVWMNYAWFYSLSEDLRASFHLDCSNGSYECVPKPPSDTTLSVTSSSCGSAANESNFYCRHSESSSSSCPLRKPEYLGHPARWRVPQGQQPAKTNA